MGSNRNLYQVSVKYQTVRSHLIHHQIVVGDFFQIFHVGSNEHSGGSLDIQIAAMRPDREGVVAMLFEPFRKVMTDQSLLNRKVHGQCLS